MNEPKVNHPAHYNQGKIEVIDAIEEWKLCFKLGNAVKYIARAGHKSVGAEDIKKAIWYLARWLMQNGGLTREAWMALYPGKEESASKVEVKPEEANIETVSKYCNSPKPTTEQAQEYKSVPVPNGHYELKDDDEVLNSTLTLVGGGGRPTWAVPSSWSPVFKGKDVKWWRTIDPNIRFCNPGVDV